MDISSGKVTGLAGVLLKVGIVALLVLGVSLAQKPSGNGKTVMSSEAAVMLNAVDEAQSSATSYRMRMAEQNSSMNRILTQEVSCPGRKHISMAEKGKVKSDTYQIDGAEYAKSARGHVWHKIPAPYGITSKTVSGCPGGPDDYLGGSFNLSQLIRDIRIGQRKGTTEISKGDSTNVNGQRCEIWDIVTKNLLNETESIELCIRSKDSLPLRISMDEPEGTTQVTYWDWNSPNIKIGPQPN